ncbi:EAL domain-containing protein [Cetobacterium somerae]|uniref:EAL domain-containing protein n=1 Tax=Cetobacterium somerae TaxID=188913 RepID=UPI00211F35A5|nr:EAL domain-containing protein [Cetobacterium somerae]MCQ9626156.1 EAL domain-containing protein [Cetobacterium somerae]
MIYRLFIFIFLVIFNFTFSEVYTPKTSKEREEFKQLQKEKLVIGIVNDPFYNLSFPHIQSLNDTAKSFLRDYMQLNVTFKLVSYKNLEQDIKSGTIDGVALIPKNYTFDKSLDFSNSIFSEEIFVISQTIPLNSLKDLDNKIIYTPYMESYKDILNAVLDNNDLTTYPISVENLSNYTDKLILTTNPVLYKPNYGIKVGNSSGVTIALAHKYIKILPFINKALNDGYREIFLKEFNSLSKSISYNNFYTSLTPEEKKYLENLPPIKVAYENKTNSLVSYKSEIDGLYKGIAPNIFKILKNNLKIDFIDITDNQDKTTENLKNNEFDTMVLSKTQKRSEDFIFSKKIYEIGTYIINLDNNPSSSGTIGVLKDNVEEHIAKRYDVDKNIIVYDNVKSMIAALEKGEVDNLLVTNKEDFDSNKYNIIPFETIPVNFMFNKDNFILRDLINKAFMHSIDLKDLAEISQLERETENKIINLRNKEIKELLLGFSVLFVFIIFAVSIYLYKERLNKKSLLKDSLTNLPNRFIFDKFCSEQNSLIGSTFVIDLNNFKNINDSLGHEFGDTILKEFANFLKNSFIDSYIFRISGDEFYGFSFENHNKIIEKLKKYKEFCPTLLKYNITFNLGISHKIPSISLATSFRYSDLAMLETKKEKSSFYKIADEKFIEKMNRESCILSLLKEDISGIYAALQPKYCIKTNKIIGAESLARYKSLELGSIGPFEFIPIAEKYNFIHKVDYKIARESIIYIRDLINNEVNLDNFRISFNISMKTFKRDDLITVISSLLSYFKVPGKYIEIEITESIFVLDMKDLITKLKALKDLDIQISLDDFTAGHSTAGLLPLLPIDVVKFDKSLLDSIDINEAKGKIVYKNLTSLIKDLNFKIVSEGVETKEQLEFLKFLGVDYAQGYYFSKPISKDEFAMEVKTL